MLHSTQNYACMIRMDILGDLNKCIYFKLSCISNTIAYFYFKLSCISNTIAYFLDKMKYDPAIRPLTTSISHSTSTLYTVPCAEVCVINNVQVPKVTTISCK